MIYSDILRRVKTVHQAKEISYEIDMLVASLFKKESFHERLKTIRALTSEDIINAMLENKIEISNHQAIKNFLVELISKIHSLKPFKIYLGFQPLETTIDKIFSWVSANLGFGYVLDIEEDKTIIGGAMVAFEGRYKDHSLKKSIERAFANKKEEIVRVLNS